MAPRTDFPPVRACIFDMDGLLLNTEDMYSACANHVLNKYGRPDLPWPIKAKLMGVPGGSHNDTFHNWAQLPISREQYLIEQSEQQHIHFPECKALPGVEKLLHDLEKAYTVDGKKVEIALATSCMEYNFRLKTSRPETQMLFEVFPEDRRILGDDVRVKQGRGKPAPEIWLVALQAINESLRDGEKIKLEECLIFEDSIPGVESGRRAGMRVIWVPHPQLINEVQSQAKEILAGRSGLMNIGDEEQLGDVDDGWAEILPSLEEFPYAKFGIKAP